MHYLSQVLRHDIKDKAVLGKMKEVAPHLILDNFTTSLGERTANILKHLFPMPKDESKRVITFANQKDYISFRCVSLSRLMGGGGVECGEERRSVGLDAGGRTS